MIPTSHEALISKEELLKFLDETSKSNRILDFWVWWWAKAQHSGEEVPNKDYVRNNLRYNDAPFYTSSVDAALTLVPSAWRVRVVWRDYATWKVLLEREDDPMWASVIGQHSLLPVALCLAVLRAK